MLLFGKFDGCNSGKRFFLFFLLFFIFHSLSVSADQLIVSFEWIIFFFCLNLHACTLETREKYKFLIKFMNQKEIKGKTYRGKVPNWSEN